MIETVVFIIFMVIPMCGLACLFGKKAFEKKEERKWLKCGIAVVCALVAVGIALLYICSFFVSSLFEDSITSILLSILVGTVLFWIAIFYVKGSGKKILLFMAPSLYLIMLVVIVLGKDSSLSMSEVKYKTHEDVEALLGVSDLPTVGFCKAERISGGDKVWMKLKNDADSTKLYKVFKRLKAKRPLQISNIDFLGDIFMLADNDKEEYVNVEWKSGGLIITYGSIWGCEIGQNKQIFDSIQAPFPNAYKYVTFMPRQVGWDWNNYERIEFDKPVSLEWLDKVRIAAKSHEHWYFEEDNKCYSFGYDYGGGEEKLPRIYTRVKLYKNLKGKRKIADINWGDY